MLYRTLYNIINVNFDKFIESLLNKIYIFFNLTDPILLTLYDNFDNIPPISAYDQITEVTNQILRLNLFLTFPFHFLFLTLHTCTNAHSRTAVIKISCIHTFVQNNICVALTHISGAVQ